MPLRADQLSAALQQSLQSIYLISGDETLLVEEACDAVLRKAREQGFTERSIHHVESGFKWHDVINDAASLSLFAERKVLDLRIPAGKFDKEASRVLRDWADGSAGNPDTMLVIRTERLQPRQRSSAWFKAIESSGTVVLIWPLAPRELPGWLEKRLQGKGLALQTDALHALAER